MVGRAVSILYPTPRDTLRAIVLSADPPRYRMSDGSVMVAPFGVTLFPADMVESERATIATVESRGARARFEVGYTVIGVPWQAQYALTLSDGGRGRLTGAAVVQSDGMALDSTEFSVVEGHVARVPVLFPVRSPQEQMRLGTFNQQAPPAAPPADSIRVYPVVGRHPLRRGEVVNLPLVAGGAVQVARVYVVPGIFAPPPSQPLQSVTQDYQPAVPSTRMSMGPNPLMPSLRYRLTGDARSPLAGALPSGIARIYGPAGASGTMLLAEANVPNPSPGGLLELVAGPTTDIVANRIAYESLVEQDTLVTESGSKTVRAIATVYRESVRLQNRTAADVVVEILEQRGESFTVLSSSVRPEPLASGGVRFQVTVPARGEALFTARLRVPVS
jgi:hypothetical protein